jgi:hypothetical protein
VWNGEVVDLSPAGSGRMDRAGVLRLLALLAWQTMEPGKFRSLTWCCLVFLPSASCSEAAFAVGCKVGLMFEEMLA